MAPLSPPDVAGRTHLGRVRSENQDHFLACTLDASGQRRVTSLPEDPDTAWMRFSAEVASRHGSVALAAVADGVGGGPAGEVASRQTLLQLPPQLSGVLREETRPPETQGRLTSAVLRVHGRLMEMSEEDGRLAGMATTLTVWLGLGDRAYVLQVGDSRCYRLRDGGLHLLTRDQTMAQDLVDQGLIDHLSEAPLGWDNILTGAVGGTSAEPVVTVTDRRPGDVVLVCSDGVLKHVSDTGIAEVLGRDTDAGGMVEELVQRALDDGGTDNIACVVLRELP